MTLRTIKTTLLTKFNELHRDVHGKPYNSGNPPNLKSNEVIEYLFQDLNLEFSDVEKSVEDCDCDDEGIEEDFSTPDFAIDRVEVGEDVEEEEDIRDSDKAGQNSTDSKGIPGWKKVDAIAHALLFATGISLETQMHRKYLNEYDKRPLQFQPVAKKASKGKFCESSKNETILSFCCFLGFVSIKEQIGRGSFHTHVQKIH